MSTQALRYAALIAMATGLAACNDGGGGGGGDSTTSESDDPEFAKDVPEDDATIDSDSADSTSSTSVDSASTTLEGSQESGNLAFTVIGDAETSTTKTRAPGARGSVSDTYSCSDGGTASYEGSYPDDGDVSTEGAEYSVQFNDCVEGGKTYNGGMDFELTGNAQQTSLSLAFVFDDMRATDGGNIVWRTHGDLTYTYAQHQDDGDTPFTTDQDYKSFRMESNELYTQTGDEAAKVEDLDMVARQGKDDDVLFSYDVQVSTTDLGGWVTVHTTTAFETLDGETYPDSGEIYIASGKRAEDEETDPDYVRLEATDGNNEPLYYVDEGNGESSGNNVSSWTGLSF